MRARRTRAGGSSRSRPTSPTATGGTAASTRRATSGTSPSRWRRRRPVADVVPFIGYEDPGAAADWLVRAFGFEEVERLEEDGEVGHVTLRCGDGLVFLGHPDGYVNPLHLREQCEAAARMYDVPWIVDGVWIAAGDLEARTERARA